ncbi:thioredoxin family protein [Jiella mangrovi]|uniref:Thioredoxin family protein n=1 Tax=Jiella mangrovi TaxID=2821407 RepID=A0ABS4BBJ4_9HYPH|nr:thioredoxin family protein [Jiella mangrovi]MBP0614123.1 thioredoxin family protein [Jiella mangrovi]
MSRLLASAPSRSLTIVLALTAILCGALMLSTPVRAAELLMFEQPGCPFCRKFDAEIAPGYPSSRIGQIAPLRRVDIYETRTGGILGLTPAVFTPTFVLVGDDGSEIGRLEGYPGERWFYPEIEALLDGREAKAKATAGRTIAPSVR